MSRITCSRMKNYINLFVNNLRFQIDIKNTLIFTAVFVLGCLIPWPGISLAARPGIEGVVLPQPLYLSNGDLVHRYRRGLALADELPPARA